MFSNGVSLLARCALLGFNLLLAFAGCTTAPVTVRRDRFNFNEAGAESTKEQILLNVVRLRYGEPIYFVEIGSMLSHYTLYAGGHYGGSVTNEQLLGPRLRAVYGLRGEHPQSIWDWGVDLNYSDSPTITYMPLTGEQFAQRVMTPIPTATVVELAQSGWGIDRLLECCVQELNGIRNTPAHETGAAYESDVERFQLLAGLLKKLQDAGRLRFSVESAAREARTYLYSFPVTPELVQDAEKLRQLLGVQPESLRKLRLVDSGDAAESGAVVIQTRSLLAAMYALARSMPVPEEHARTQQAGAPGMPDEERGTWLNIKHSPVPQPDPFVQVFHYGYWFYIDKDDWSSKRTFALLTYLFSLQASAPAGQSVPLITTSPGR